MKYKILFALAWCLVYVNALAQSSMELNEAQTLIYNTNHLEGLEKGTKLHYQYIKSSNVDDGFTETVTLSVAQEREDHRKDLNLTFLSGDKEIVFDPFSGFRTNPVIMAVLERDVREMSRMTGGGMLYFRNRVREEMARDPEIKTVEIEHNGKKIDTTQIQFKPFVNDPMVDRFKDFKQKTYSIFLTNEVPGSVVRVNVLTPSAAGGEPLISETLSLESSGE
ncbi:MAG: hypothetical protein OER96_04940 [Gammaproteobacteria bacterium]|nr:hypothetical protein [Gammaproteobacteria bacterium]